MKRGIQAFFMMVVAGILLAASAAAEPPKKQIPLPVENVDRDRGNLQNKTPIPIFTATLSADPESSSGNCPAKITFKGKITLQGPILPSKSVEVKYRFKRSDGGVDPNIKTLTFTQPGSQDVSTTWTLGGSNGLPLYCGWQSIEIIAPQKVSSNQATFSLQCSHAQPPNFQITDMFMIPEGNGKCYIGFKVKNVGNVALNPPDSWACPVKHLFVTWVYDSAQHGIGVEFTPYYSKYPGGEDTFKLSSMHLTKSPFTIVLKLKREHPAGGWTGKEVNMTKALTCP